MKKTDGFTLVELMVGIVCSALVTGAIITFMLMGVKTNRSVIDANADQRNAKIVITMMENLASEGAIGSVEQIGDASNSDWTVYDGPIATGSPVLSYSATTQSLRGRNGTALMEGVIASSVEISTTPKNLLKFNIKTESGDYTTSVYCRSLNLAPKKEIGTGEFTQEAITKIPSTESTQESRIEFLRTLSEQYGSTGQIMGDTKTYTLWYCEKETGRNGYFSGWGPDTPWCATFVSWAINQNSDYLNYTADSIPREANVDTLYTKVQRVDNDPDYDVLPGDLVFFDWDYNSKVDSPDLEHVGVLLYKDTNWIYTIEGNSGGCVALRRYAINDPCIFDYGILNWKEAL